MYEKKNLVFNSTASLGRCAWFSMQNSNLKSSWNRTNVGETLLSTGPAFTSFFVVIHIEIIHTILSESLKFCERKRVKTKNRNRVSGKSANISGDQTTKSFMVQKFSPTTNQSTEQTESSHCEHCDCGRQRPLSHNIFYN